MIAQDENYSIFVVINGQCYLVVDDYFTDDSDD